MKKNKYKIIIFGIAIVIVLGAIFSKVLLPNAISETTTALQTEAQTSQITTHIMQTSEEYITTKVHTTAVTVAEIISTVTEPETSASAEKETTVKSETTTSVRPEFPIQIPTIKFPDIQYFTTELPTTPSGEIDLSCFDNTAFIGNSRFTSFKNYGLAKNVYSVVGLNVDTVFTKSVSGSSVTVINELNGKNFDKVILLFGDNECGWPNQNVFIERYAKVIAAVRERTPRAEIYLHAILPVSAESSAENNFGCNNQTINSMNEKIRQLAADEGVNYIEQPPYLKNSDGALLSEAASDGIHLNKKYSKIWLEYLARTII